MKSKRNSKKVEHMTKDTFVGSFFLVIRHKSHSKKMTNTNKPSEIHQLHFSLI